MLDNDLFSQGLVRYMYMINPIAAAMDAAGWDSMQGANLFAAHLKLVTGFTALLLVASVLKVIQLRRAD
ncbi:MAG TPA: hypothetical protein ENL03_01270 [Phycisphaerae bacterium]|nr:hypothetical protein [Phycisphaerae bacterium]